MVAISSDAQHLRSCCARYCRSILSIGSDGSNCSTGSIYYDGSDGNDGTTGSDGVDHNYNCGKWGQSARGIDVLPCNGELPEGGSPRREVASRREGYFHKGVRYPILAVRLGE